MEDLIFVASIVLTGVFLFKWYKQLFKISTFNNSFIRNLFSWTPVIIIIILIFVLTNYASFDVVNDSYYILYYILLGFGWIYFSQFVLFFFLGLSWIDDGLNSNNKAAGLSIFGELLSLSILFLINLCIKFNFILLSFIFL